MPSDLGVEWGLHYLKPLDKEFRLEALLKGINDALNKDQQLLPENQRRSYLGKAQEIMSKKEQERFAEHKAKGEAFLAENQKKEGITTLPSGLQYEILKKGSGESPKADNQVVVHYRGTFVDGKEFDSSYERGKPITFPLTEVIQGWSEGLQLMKVGGKWKLYIPSDLAYGVTGRSPKILPYSTLIFEVELIEIK